MLSMLIKLLKLKITHYIVGSYRVFVMVNFIPLNALRTKISFPAIRVKIISKWSAKIGGDHHSVMLLGDENVSFIIF